MSTRKDSPGARTVAAALERDLKRIAERDKSLADGALAAAARALALELDNPRNSATSKSMCAKALHDITDRLRELAPEERTKDRLDELEDEFTAKRLAKRTSAPAR